MRSVFYSDTSPQTLDTALPFATLTLYGVRFMVEIGDRLLVDGGYDYDPKWLKGKDGCVGTVIRFLWEGDDHHRKLVLDLGEDFHTCEFKGRYLILFLRYADSHWEDEGVVLRPEAGGHRDGACGPPDRFRKAAAQAPGVAPSGL